MPSNMMTSRSPGHNGAYPSRKTLSVRRGSRRTRPGQTGRTAILTNQAFGTLLAIGERVCDKIAASKRKGLWLGGNAPLGYANVGKKLVVVPEEAETVRGIFRRYLEFGSIGALAQDLDYRGVRTKQRQLADGRLAGGVRFGVGALHVRHHN